MGWEITLLGDVSLRGTGPDADSAEPLRSPKARFALALLTLERDRGVSRDALADALWPEGLPPTWDSALRTVVSRVRAYVSHGLGGHGGVHLVALGGTYRLELPADVVVDVDLVEQQIDQAKRAFGERRFEQARELVGEAVSRLRAPFLSDHDDEWVEALRARLAELLVVGLELVSSTERALGDDAAALAAAVEAVGQAPLRESAHRALMAAHAAAGNRAEALMAYQRLRHVLAEELGVDPDAETEAAYLGLLGPPEPTRPEVRAAVPFVGRDRELAVASSAWAGAIAGERRMLLLTGEPGIGKTRLATELAQRVGAEGALVLFGRCEREALVPYQPVVEMLDALAAATPEAELPALTAAARAELAAVFPAFTRWRQPVRSRPEDRLVLFDSVAKLVTQAARDRPLLIILDDLQWADGDSCLLVRHLLRHAGRGRILVLAIARNELTETHPLGETVRSLDQGDQLIRLQVGGLDQEACRELLQENRPEAGGDNPALAAQLHTDTSGNPFMVIELLRGGPNGTAPIWPGSGPVPAGLDDLVTSRLAPLGPAVRALLEAAAVSGSQFELDVTAAAAGLDETAGLDAVGMALASGLVFEAGPDDCYRFTHDIVRRTLSQLLGGARRRRLHERVADAIEERRAHRLAGLTATLAHHRCSAAERGGDVRAVRWALAAAADAAARNAFSDAVRWCRRAQDHLPAGDGALEAEVLTELGRAQAQAGDSDGRSTLVEGGLQARRCGRLDLAARAALGLAELAQRRPEHREDAAALVHDVLVHVGEQEAQLPPPLWARLVAREIEIGQTGDVTEAATAAAVLRRRLDDHENPDQIQERAVLAEDLFVVAEATGDSEQRTVALHHRAMVAALVGEWPATEAALAAMTGSDSGMRRRLLEERAAALAVAQGRFAEIPPTPAGPLPLGSLAPGVLVARQWFVARWLQGRLDPSSVDAYGVDDPAQIGLVRVEQILRAIGEGDRAPARIAAHQLISQAEPLPSGDGWLHAVGLLGLAVVELDDPGLALDLCGLLAPHATLTCGAGYRSFVGTVAFHLGRLAALAGEGADAERHLTTALRQLTQLRAQPWIALAQHSLAGVLEARGRSSDRDLITALRSEARWVADQLALRELP